MPPAHPPGHAQADFGEAVAVVGGVERKIHFFCLDLPHSDAGFVKAYPAERLEAFCDGHNAAFAFWSGWLRSYLCTAGAMWLEERRRFRISWRGAAWRGSEARCRACVSCSPSSSWSGPRSTPCGIYRPNGISGSRSTSGPSAGR